MRRWSRKGSMVGGWVGWLRRVGGGSLADYVAGWPGERNAGEDAATPCAEEARLLDRGEYIRNVLPPTLYPATYLRPLLFSLSLSIPCLSLPFSLSSISIFVYQPAFSPSHPSRTLSNSPCPIYVCLCPLPLYPFLSHASSLPGGRALS